MPLNKRIKKVLLIGSGPTVIGQAAEFDYAGTQACLVLKEAGIETVLVNSNPATIMTDSSMADAIYIEPLTLDTIKRIIIKEKPDSILSGLGGQTGLTLCMQLAKTGFLKEHGIKLLGSSPETIDKAEDRQVFKDTMQKIGIPLVPSDIATSVEQAIVIADKLGYPLVIRPAFTMGGAGGGFANNEQELKDIVANGLNISPIKQVLVEKSIAGWKEIEFEIMRDSSGNTIAIASMENVDPMGVHTGDSMVVAPALTLTPKELGMLKHAAINIVNEVAINGGCNVQFALNPHSFEYAVIEINPRVSRSSALASKATGYPIAKVSTKVAIGYNLDEIVNGITGNTYASTEPTIDYLAFKFPKFPFDKFVYGNRLLGTQMKATGEVMTIADSFEHALLKAIRGAELGIDTLNLPKLQELGREDILELLTSPTDERIFVCYKAIKLGIELDTIYDKTKIDKWFLNCLKNIYDMEAKLQQIDGDTDQLGVYNRAKSMGFVDSAIDKLAGMGFCDKLKQANKGLHHIYRAVDTCAAEYKAKAPYFYSEWGGSCDVRADLKANPSTKKKVLVLGSGPIRIGQGIEFDYASVHCVKTLKKLGYEVVVINNNPETVSTDFETADKLYFEALHIEDVMSVIQAENPIGVIVTFGGGTAIKLAQQLQKRGVKILGTSPDSIDLCEDRGKFDDMLNKLDLKRPKGDIATTVEQATTVANELGYPVLLRPSYVLGGQNMIIAHDDSDVEEYMKVILSQSPIGVTVLVDKYISGVEIEIDAISDGVDVLVPGIMEHIERTGVHSGDSMSVYPSTKVHDELARQILDITQKICVEVQCKGLINIQMLLKGQDIYIIEVNPRASRTVPFVSKVLNLPIAEYATRAALGQKLKDIKCGTGIAPIPPYVAVKVPVFSFEKLIGVDTHLGPEMKSTGEVLGLGKNVKEALFKGMLAAGYKMNVKSGGIFVSVTDIDKAEIVDIASKFEQQSFVIYATQGTAKALNSAGVPTTIVDKISDQNQNSNASLTDSQSQSNSVIDLLQSGKINYIISTSSKGRNPARDSVKIRRHAVLMGIPCFTSLDTASAFLQSLTSGYEQNNTELVNINDMRDRHQELKFVKMHGAGNDYIFVDSRRKDIDQTQNLAMTLSNRNYGIGSDGIVFICKSSVADAQMLMYNADGSQGAMCGNAIRCVAKYLYDNGITTKKDIKIETLAGIKKVSVVAVNGKVTSATVDMGKPLVVDSKVIQVENIDKEITFVDIGNPHCVHFCPKGFAGIPFEKRGPVYQNHESFEGKQPNVEFVHVSHKYRLSMMVWERGSGETLACGTGACASVLAAIDRGYMSKNTDITVVAKGGTLIVRVTDDTVLMTGDCHLVYSGVVEI